MVSINFPFERIEYPSKIIYENNNLNMPKILAHCVSVIKKRYQRVPENQIINLLLVKMAQLVTSKRVKYIENETTQYCNYYSIILMPSGEGKDRMSNDIDNFAFSFFKDWFKNEVNKLKEQYRKKIEEEFEYQYTDKNQQKQKDKYIKEKMKEFRNIVMDITDGTREGLISDAKALKQANFGCLMIKNAELGQFLWNMTTDQKLFFDELLEAYSGIIRSKCIKGERREENIEDLPANVLLYSDPTLFKSNLEKLFNKLMENGLSRRCIITFMDKSEKYELEKNPYIALIKEKEYYKNLKLIGVELKKFFDSVLINSHYKLTEETFIKVFYNYRLKIDKLSEEENNTLMKKEIKSRELKALKISCLYACINHPLEYSINPEDMEMAIATVEKLSQDFKKFISYKPAYEDKYDRIYQFFLENLNTEFKKTDLTTNYCKKFGYSRENFRKNFENIMEIVEEIAKSKGYFLFHRKINNNSGIVYWLTEEKNDLNMEVKDLESLLTKNR